VEFIDQLYLRVKSAVKIVDILHQKGKITAGENIFKTAGIAYSPEYPLYRKAGV
jgi:hypothetical protein